MLLLGYTHSGHKSSPLSDLSLHTSQGLLVIFFLDTFPKMHMWFFVQNFTTIQVTTLSW